MTDRRAFELFIDYEHHGGETKYDRHSTST